MATASPKKSTGTKCYLCFEKFREPKLLPCAHLLCRQCLQSWTQTRSGARCPQCNYSIVQQERRGKQSLDTTVGGLPTELSMVAYVKAENLLKQLHLCCACVGVAATCLCLDCGALFCQSCKNTHNKQKISRRHRVEDLSSLSADKVYAINRPVMCPVHTDKVCEIFCISHDTAICQVCAMTLHRDCREMKDLNELMEQAHAEVERLTARLKAGEDKMDCTIQQLDQHLQDTKEEKQSMIKRITANCDRMDAAVKVCRHRLTEQTLSAYSDIETAVNNGKTYLLGDKARMTTHKHVAQRVQGLQDREDVGTMTTVLKSNMDGLNYNATLPADAEVISKMMLVMDPEVVSQLEKALSELGQVKVVPSNLDARLKHQPLTWCFHDKHGSDVVLSNNQQTAEGITGYLYCGLVFSKEAVDENILYEVLIDEIDNSFPYTAVGVLIQSPDNVNMSCRDELLKSAVAVSHNAVFINGEGLRKDQFSALRTATEGDTIGVLVDDARGVHVYLNDEDLGLITPPPDVGQTLHAVFGVGFRLTKVTTLPTRRI